MAIGTTAALIGGAVIGAISSSSASKRAAKSTSKAAKAASAGALEQYYQSREDFAPWRQAGTAALGEMMDVMGLQRPAGFGGSQMNPALADWESRKPQYTPPTGLGQQSNNDKRGLGNRSFGATGGQAPGLAEYDQAYQQSLSEWEAARPRDSVTIDGATGQVEDPYAKFRASPGYQFQMDQGEQAINRYGAATGAGGAQGKALVDYSQGVADQSFGKYFSRLQSLAGQGQTATGSTANLGAQATGMAGQYGMMAGQANANNAINQGNNISNLVNQGSQLYAMSNFNSPPPNQGNSFSNWDQMIGANLGR